MNRLLVSAAHKSSGKTTVSVGLCAALRARGLAVQPFKKGPDYIDPLWLGAAAGRACRNLDPYLSPLDELRAAFASAAADAAVALVEGNKGLYDGLALDGSNSNAAVAVALDLPVVLVLDARGMTRGVAPLILGYQAFDRAVRIAGVVLNRLGGSRHESKLRAVIEHYTDVPVLGALQEGAGLAIDERHLGLIPASEAEHADATIARIAAAVAAGVDLDALLAATRLTPAPRAHDDSPARWVQPSVPGNAGNGADASAADPAPDAGASAGSAAPPARAPAPPPRRLRVAIARDRAFGFYYAEDLAGLRRAGAELVAFDTLADRGLPPADALWIGGGFPEVLAARIAANTSLLAALRRAIDEGLPAYAECGGLMVLARRISWRGSVSTMAGALPCDVVVEPRPVGRGYVHLEETDHHPWPQRRTGIVRAHEFHHSRLENLAGGLHFAYRVHRGHGIDGSHDGLVVHNLLASYAHLRSVAGHDWPARFVAFARGAAGGLARAAAGAACPA